MARTPISERPLVAQWLIESRKRFENPATGRPWSAEHFLEELRAETGWAPNIANYAQWESGEVTPRDENLRPVVEFYAKRDVPGPVVPEPSQPAPDLAAALMALADELREMRAERAALWEQIGRQADAIEMLTARLSGERPDPLILERTMARGVATLDALDAARQPRQAPAGQ